MMDFLRSLVNRLVKLILSLGCGHLVMKLCSFGRVMYLINSLRLSKSSSSCE